MTTQLMAAMTVAFLALTTAAHADKAGDFDYFVMALSWSPTWCAEEGDRSQADQCDIGSGFGFTLHGLWPQYERGYPENCRAITRDPSKKETAAMADIMGSGGLAWYQWKKHGRCAGLDPSEYFAAARAAYKAIERPSALRKLPRAVDVPPGILEEAFMEINPGLARDMITVKCAANRLDEVRICLTKDLEFRNCGEDIRQDCRATTVRVDPIR